MLLYRVISTLLIFLSLCLNSDIFCADKESLMLTENAFANVAEKIGPAVVSVTVIQVYKIMAKKTYNPFERYDPYSEEFFNEFFGQPYEYRQSGMGSGVIIDKEGYVLTNEHVISGASEIEVTLSDGRKFKGEVKGSDPMSDLAVIKIDAPNLPFAELGDSENIKVGQWVVAVGNPFGFIMSNPQPSISVGVISALHRSFSYTGVDQSRYYGDLIQTDAAINRGNSGGPLVDINGKIIGINALIFSTTGGYQGLGFAIPINRAKQILDELISGKEIKYGWLGVQVQSVSRELSFILKLSDEKGALIADIIKDSPADKGGLKKGDVVKKINGEDVIDSNDLVVKVSHFPVGEKIKVQFIREGKETELFVEIGEKPKEKTIIQKKQPAMSEKGWRGIEVMEINDDVREELDVSYEKGVVVAVIDDNSTGALSGMREGDIIDEINRGTVDSVDDFNKITENLTGEVLVHTKRGYFVVKEKK